MLTHSNTWLTIARQPFSPQKYQAEHIRIHTRTHGSYSLSHHVASQHTHTHARSHAFHWYWCVRVVWLLSNRFESQHACSSFECVLSEKSFHNVGVVNFNINFSHFKLHENCLFDLTSEEWAIACKQIDLKWDKSTVFPIDLELLDITLALAVLCVSSRRCVFRFITYGSQVNDKPHAT